jgi:hypothetical protein
VALSDRLTLLSPSALRHLLRDVTLLRQRACLIRDTPPIVDILRTLARAEREAADDRCC